MIDTREDILARLVVLAGGLPYINLADRNNSDVTKEQLPAGIIFDGDEETDDVTDASMRLPARPTMVRMSPIVEIAAMAATVGSDLSVLRRELIKAVLFDTEFNEIIVRTGRNGNGAIRYVGCQTDPTWMRTLYGQMRVQFMFRYVLNPADL
jgi:hypothetical protein